MSDAIQAFQIDHGLGVDGLLGPEARERLSEDLNTGRYPTTAGHTGRGLPLTA
ncbi:hypothetical protein GCM10007147_34720 [Nocardiopsis kunsanensis]|uniref:Peptidoglycan binding-like domain-containing protein n=1 Tax=Nocardiopsis kunsanensis TaxID=141693 RepID=A0A919CJS6_9ACTN|nr:hypothetical protein GCM10007147_34720 [Nocardiopsis kunsanensis]